MKSVLLIGLGRFGRHVAMQLNEMNHQVMAIDIKENRVNAVLPYVTNALIGDATNRAFVESLGVRTFDLCIVAIGDHFQNSLESTLLLKELGAQKVVSRAARDVHAKFLLRNGADFIVYPERQIGEWTALRFASDNLLDFFQIDHDNAIVEIPIPREWLGKSIGQLDVRKKYNVTIVALKKEKTLQYRILPSTVLEDPWKLLVLGDKNTILKQFGNSH